MSRPSIRPFMEKGEPYFSPDVHFSPDSKRFFLTANGFPYAFGSLENGAITDRFPGPHESVEDASFSPDGGKLALALSNGMLSVWDASGGGLLWETPAGKSSFVQWSQDGTGILTLDYPAKAVRVFSVAGKKLLRTITLRTGGTLFKRGKPVPLHNARFLPDGNVVVFPREDFPPTVFDIKTGKPSGTWGDAFLGRCAVAGRFAACMRDETSLQVWDAAAGTLLYTIPKVGYFEMSSDGSRLLAAFKRGVRVYDTATGRELCALGSDIPYELAGCVQGDVCALWGVMSHKTVTVWNAATGELLHTITKHRHLIYGVWMSEDASRMLSSAEGEDVFHLWDTATGECLASYGGGKEVYRASLEFSPDGTRLLAEEYPKQAAVYDVTRRELLLRLKGKKPSYVAYMPDGKYIAGALGRAGIGLWRADTGRFHRMLIPESDSSSAYISGFRISPDSSLVAIIGSRECSYLTCLDLWDAATGAKLYTVEGLESSHLAYSQLSFSPDGSMLAFSTDHGDGEGNARLVLVEARSGRVLRTREGGMLSRHVSFSRDGRYIIFSTRDWDRSFCTYIWDWAEDETVLSLKQDGTTCRGPVPGGPALILPGNEGFINIGQGMGALYDLRGELLRRWPMHLGEACALAISPDATLLASASSSDGMLKVWRMDDLLR